MLSLKTVDPWPVCRIVSLLMLSAIASLEGAALPSGFTETQFATGLSSPTAMEFSPDGRLFVCQQGGQLRVIKNGVLLAAPFLTVNVNSLGERGLLGVTFDPHFGQNQYVYIYYTVKTSPLHNRVSRFIANGDVALNGETILLELDNLTSATNHNGGAIHFGIDGKLYIGAGENANGSNSQTLTNLLGKLLRINPDGSIPSDNPFFSTAAGKNAAIWALGLRNPFTFAVQPGTGRIFINDVGQNLWEEINDGIAGSNYGWPTTEGYTNDNRYRSPILAYGHGGGTTAGCAITGGTFYNPGAVQFPSRYLGSYFFADYCNGWIRNLDPLTDTVTTFATGISSPVDLKIGPDGSLYYLALGDGSVYRVRYTASQAPQITVQPQDQVVTVGDAATFSVSASGDPPLSYQWQRNGASIGGATSSSYTLSSATLADNGAQFRCVVSNSVGSAISNSATLTVSSNTRPVGNIIAPTAGMLYSLGETIGYAGTGADAEDGPLPPSAFTWSVDFHHDTHVHPFVLPTTGAQSGSFTIPTSGETSANVWYRIYLTVRDSVGLTHTSFRDVQPRIVNGGFENGAAPWVPYGTVGGGVAASQGHSGANGLAENTGDGGFFQDVSGLIPGQQYLVSAWVRATSGAGAQPILWVHDTSGANSASAFPGPVGTTWQLLQVAFTATATGRLRIHLHRGNGSGSLYWDDAAVALGSPAAGDAGFEGGSLVPWSVYGGVGAAISNAAASSGAFSLAENGGAGGVFQDVGGLTPGQIYQITARARSAPGTQGSALLWVHDSLGANVGSNSPKIASSSFFQQFVVSFVATSTGRVRIHLHYTGGAGTLYWDDVRIAMGATPQLENGGFESGIDPWLSYGTLFFQSVMSGAAHNGAFSLWLAGASGGGGGEYQDVSGLVPGQTYKIGVWVMGDAGGTAPTQLWVHDTLGANLSASVAIPGPGWQFLETSFTATNTGKVRVHLHLFQGTGFVRYDDVTVQ